MLDKIILSQDKKTATVVFLTHSVNISHDVNVIPLVTELFVEPAEKYQRSLEDTQWIITIPEYKEEA